jgi:protein tyrosine phosphatase type IVA
VRLCTETYDKEKLIDSGFQFLDLPFSDGTSPPKYVIKTWLNLVKEVFPDKDKEPKQTIGVHCKIKI